MDFRKLTSEWVRVLRGKRSQVALGKRLGYASNILYRWEAGECFPPACTFFRLAAVCGVDSKHAVCQFLGSRPRWLEDASLAEPAALAGFVRELKGVAPIAALAKKSGYSRYQVSRWLSGRTQPTLPEFLAVLDAASQRLLDFVGVFTDPARMASLSAAWSTLVAARETAYAMPWSHAILKVLTLRSYQEEAHSAAGIAARLGMPETSVDATLVALEALGQVSRRPDGYVEAAPNVVDTRSDPARARQAKTWWLGCALERLENGAPGLFAYNVSAVSKTDLQRIEQLQRQTYREMSRIIAESKEPECVVLYCAQLLRMDGQNL